MANLDWYSPPLTKEHIAKLREKLGKARGLLIDLRFRRLVDDDTLAEIEQVLDETKD